MLDQRHDAQDRHMGTNTRAEEARADAEADGDRLYELSAMLEEAIDLVVSASIEIAGGSSHPSLADLIDLPSGKSPTKWADDIRALLVTLDVAVMLAHRRARGEQS